MTGRLLRARGVVFTCLVLCNRKSQCEIICDKERLGLDLLTCLISTCRHFLVCKYSRMWPLTNSAVMKRTHCTLVSTAGTTSSRATPPVIFFWISTKWHDFFEGFVHLNIFFRGALRRGFMMIVGEREWTVSTGEAQMCVCCTLSLEGVQVVSEGVCRFSLLQDAQVAEFLHLHFLRLPLPHRDHHLNTHKQSVCRCYRTLCESRKISPPVPHIQTETDRQTDRRPPHLDFQGADGEFVQRDGEREDHFIRQNHRLVQRRLTWRKKIIMNQKLSLSSCLYSNFEHTYSNVIIFSMCSPVSAAR